MQRRKKRPPALVVNGTKLVSVGGTRSTLEALSAWRRCCCCLWRGEGALSSSSCRLAPREAQRAEAAASADPVEEENEEEEEEEDEEDAEKEAEDEEEEEEEEAEEEAEGEEEEEEEEEEVEAPPPSSSRHMSSSFWDAASALSPRGRSQAPSCCSSS